MRHVLKSLVAIALLAPIGAVARQHRADPTDADPMKIVCRSQEIAGSRLSQGKRCMTNAEWAEAKRLDRQEIERIQSKNWKSS